jgi:CcmD family protein
MDNLGYLAAAYMIFWLLSTGYLVTIERRQKEIRKTLERLERQKS